MKQIRREKESGLTGLSLRPLTEAWTISDNH